MKGLLYYIPIARQPTWSVGGKAQVSPEDINLVELGDTGASSAPSGGAIIFSSRRATRRELQRREVATSNSEKENPIGKESISGKAKTNVPTAVKRKKSRERTFDLYAVSLLISGYYLHEIPKVSPFKSLVGLGFYQTC